MKLKSVMITGATIVILLLIPTTHVFARDLTDKERESGFYRENGSVISNTKERPAINPDFAPDRSCDLKWELKCIPGREQSCFDLGKEWGNGEMNVCTPAGCPEGYHNIAEWEDQVCYSNEIDCPDDLVLAKSTYGEMCKEPEVS